MPSLPPNRIAQAAIPVRDLDRAKLFYGHLLGLAHLFDAPPALAFYQCGETRLMLSAGEPADGEGILLYFGVTDVAEAHGAATAGGAASLVAPHVIAEVEGKEIHLAILDDGEGNRVGLISG
jgi:predicted enzyme related to lactoylglutathione lyase